MVTRFRTAVLCASLIFSSLSFADEFDKFPLAYRGHREVEIFFLKSLFALSYKNLNFSSDYIERLWNRIFGDGSSSEEIEKDVQDADRLTNEFATYRPDGEADESLGDEVLLQMYFSNGPISLITSSEDEFIITQEEFVQLRQTFGMRVYLNYENRAHLQVSNDMVYLMLMIIRGHDIEGFLKELNSKKRAEFDRMRNEAKFFTYHRLMNEFDQIDSRAQKKLYLLKKLISSEEFRRNIIYVYPFMMNEDDFFDVLRYFFNFQNSHNLSVLREIIAQFNEFPDDHLPLGMLNKRNVILLEELREIIQMKLDRKRKHSLRLNLLSLPINKIEKLAKYTDSDIAEAMTLSFGVSFKKLILSEINKSSGTFSQIGKESDGFIKWIRSTLEEQEDPNKKIKRLKKWISICYHLLSKNNFHTAYFVVIVLEDHIKFIVENEERKQRRDRSSSQVYLGSPLEIIPPPPETPRGSHSQYSGVRRNSPRQYLDSVITKFPKPSTPRGLTPSHSNVEVSESPRNRASDKDKVPKRFKTVPQIVFEHFTHQEVNFIQEQIEFFSHNFNYKKYRKKLEMMISGGESMIPIIPLWTKDFEFATLALSSFNEIDNKKLTFIKEMLMGFHKIQKNYKIEDAYDSLFLFFQGLNEHGISTMGHDPFKSPRSEDTISTVEESAPALPPGLEMEIDP